MSKTLKIQIPELPDCPVCGAIFTSFSVYRERERDDERLAHDRISFACGAEFRRVVKRDFQTSGRNAGYGYYTLPSDSAWVAESPCSNVLEVVEELRKRIEGND
jgi:hypothetical protein